MRLALVVGLTLAITSSAVGDDRPIPQDAARITKRFEERLVWNRKTLQRAYDQVGKKDPRWDVPAREALELAARMFAKQVDPVINNAEIHAKAKKAVDAGCDDPMIKYLFARTSFGTESSFRRDYDRLVQSACQALEDSGYSPYRRAVAIRVAVETKAWMLTLTPEQRKELERKLDTALDLLPRSIIEDPRGVDWDDAWYRDIRSVIAAHRQLSGDYKAAFDRVDARLAKIRAVEALRLAIKGDFLVNYAWEARTAQVAAKVTEDQFRAFEARLVEAREVLTRAWKLNPTLPHVADSMLTVEKGIGGGDREAMETWFLRAMTLDPNDQQACWAKLDWLDPKWYGGGSFDEMLAFAKACAATGNYRDGITLLVGDAHFRVWQRLPQGERVKYMRDPEVWNEIRAVYDEYFKHYPDDDAQRSKFAMIAYLGAHYPAAHAQFQGLGDRLTTWAVRRRCRWSGSSGPASTRRTSWPSRSPSPGRDKSLFRRSCPGASGGRQRPVRSRSQGADAPRSPLLERTLKSPLPCRTAARPRAHPLAPVRPWRRRPPVRWNAGT